MDGASQNFPCLRFSDGSFFLSARSRLECFTALVTYTRTRLHPASSKARSAASLQDTDERPPLLFLVVSTVALPTATIRAFAELPNTPCVAFRYRSHAVQCEPLRARTSSSSFQATRAADIHPSSQAAAISLFTRVAPFPLCDGGQQIFVPHRVQEIWPPLSRFVPHQLTLTFSGSLPSSSPLAHWLRPFLLVS